MAEKTDHEVLRQFVIRPDPVLHPSELTDALDMTRQGVYQRFRKLEDRGFLDSKKAASARVFWLTDDGHRYYCDMETAT